jgi:hypothetical protein
MQWPELVMSWPREFGGMRELVKMRWATVILLETPIK